MSHPKEGVIPPPMTRLGDTECDVLSGLDFLCDTNVSVTLGRLTVQSERHMFVRQAQKARANDTSFDGDIVWVGGVSPGNPDYVL
jgi:hypothetical protein